jgi:serine/threonine protein kinase
MSNLHQSVVDQVRARIGTTLKDKWHIDALIGMGGMAAVYAATHRTGSRVAIKMLHPQLSMNESVRKRFAREGYVANAIGHPGVARVLDDDVASDGSAFLVMELLEGETAAARAERYGGHLPLQEVVFIGQAVADVLAAAHAAKIIHRDIKPDNVFITNDNRVVVLDFGIARIADATGTSELGTRTGTMMGTPAFMPPEQARGRANEMDATSDVWALGATLFWLASGRVVHEAETPNEQLVAAATLPAPSLARVAPDLPTAIVEVIDKALEFAKENRFPDAVALKHALQEAVLAISWGPGSRPALSVPPSSNDETEVDVRTPYKPLAAQLPLAGSDDAPTVDMNHRGRGATIGPVEVAPRSGRAARFVRAAVVGALLGAAVLVVAAVVGRRMSAVNASAAPAPSVTVSVVASVSASAIVSAVASVQPPVVETAEPVPSASASARPAAPSALRPVAPATTRKSWLDRRK